MVKKNEISLMLQSQKTTTPTIIIRNFGVAVVQQKTTVHVVNVLNI